MGDSIRNWWERSGENMVNLVLIGVITLATLWAIYLWLALPFQAPLSFLAGFTAVAGYVLYIGFRGEFGDLFSPKQASVASSPSRPLSTRLSNFGFIVGAALVFGSWGGAFLALLVTVIAQGGISSDCSPGVPMRYC